MNFSPELAAVLRCTRGLRQVIVAYVGILLFLCGDRPVFADDFTTLRQAWGNYLTGGTNLNLADPAVSAWVANGHP
jgi:hypothetical protein